MDLSYSGLLGSISVPDIITPEQYADMRRSHAKSQSGENRLRFAILDDAVRILQKGKSTMMPQKRLFFEAQDWVDDQEDTGPFAFEAICDALEINSDWLRKGLSVWLARQEAGNAMKLARRSYTNTSMKVSEVKPHQRLKQVASFTG